MDPIVIIGTGLAGYNVAKEIRKLDKSADLMLVTADGGESYSKPMLSNALGKGKTPGQLILSTAEQMADSLSAKIISRTRISSIDTQSQSIYAGTSSYPYSKLVLALGATPVNAQFEGNASDAIVRVNNLDDYVTFRQALESAQHIGIIGAGLIGCEFANDLISVGKKVTIVGNANTPLNKLLPSSVAEFIQDKFSSAGIQFKLGNKVAAVEKAANRFDIHLSDGSVLNVDLVVSAIGLQPKTELAGQAGLAVNKGIVANHLLQTSSPNVFALGDCVEVNGLVLPFVLPLMHSARSLAKTLTGTATPLHYPAMPVVIKTPFHPIVVSPPVGNGIQQWTIDIDTNGAKALCHDELGSLIGFAVTGDKIPEKQSLAKQLPAVLN